MEGLIDNSMNKWKFSNAGMAASTMETNKQIMEALAQMFESMVMIGEVGENGLIPISGVGLSPDPRSNQPGSFLLNHSSKMSCPYLIYC